MTIPDTSRRHYTKPKLKSHPVALGVFGDYGQDESTLPYIINIGESEKS